MYIHSHQGKVVAEYVLTGDKPNINYFHLGNRLVAEEEHLASSINGDDIKGYGFGDSQHRYGYTHVFTLDKLPKQSAKVCVSVYAISSNEIQLKVNGQTIDALPSGTNGQRACVDIPLEHLLVGENTIEFLNSNGGTWGIGNISFTAVNIIISPILDLLLGKNSDHSESVWSRIKTATKAIVLSSIMAFTPTANANEPIIALASTAQTIKVTHIHTDADGSPFAATDSQGNLEWRRENYPYGDKYKDTNIARTSDINFAGKAHDEEIGLSYFGARWYDPQIGRFTGIDAAPVQAENWRTFNRYSYGFNNPYKYVDPDGNLPILIPIAYGLQILGAAITGYEVGSAISDVSRGEKTVGQAATSAAIGVGVGVATGGAGKVLGGIAAKTIGPMSSLKIVDGATPNSLNQYHTNVTLNKAKENLINSGYKNTVEAAGQNGGRFFQLEKGNSVYKLYDNASSTGGPTGKLYIDGNQSSNIRFDAEDLGEF